MAAPHEHPENSDDEIAQVANAYFRERKQGMAASIAAYLDRYPHLGPELGESLEAIELLLATPRDRLPDSFGDFRIDRELARGGMGTVYLATQVLLQRRVALKVLKPFSHDQAASVERFEREMQTIAALEHEGIVPIYSTGEVQGLPYFAMRWIDGQSVAQLIAQYKSTALSRRDQRARSYRIARWGAAVAGAVEYAHQQGIVHRDVKPSNLLVDRDQRIWLTDFGLACREGDAASRAAGPYHGTPNYMSPEQASAIRAPIDQRTDIYSLGVTLIEWLTGQALVGGSSPVESLSRLQHNSVEDPRRLLRGYSRDWVAVLERCVAREPKDRYQTAAELAADLRAIADRRPVSVRAQLGLTRTVRELFSHSNSLPAAGLACVAMLAAILIGGLAWRAVSLANIQRVMFTSKSGEWLQVTARDTLGRPLAEFTTADGEVSVSGNISSVDVMASQRLGYQRAISAVTSASTEGLPFVRLEAPQTHRWLCEDIWWHECRTMIRYGESKSYCLAFRSDGLVLLDVHSGQILWTFHDERSSWGNSVRGGPSTFQPDRFAIVDDINGNDCQEIVLAHAIKPELLCLDSASGERLWQTNLIESAGMQLPNAGSLCPIVLQYSDDEAVDQASRLSVVIAPHATTLATTNRGLFSVDPASGKVRWKLASLQSSAKPPLPAPNSSRPLHLQWSSADQRPIDFGEHLQFSDADGFGRTKPLRGMLNPYDNAPRLGTDRPLWVRSGSATVWHWIDGSDWHCVDTHSGELIKSWKLPDDCVCTPKLLQSADGRTLVLTAHVAQPDTTDFIAWDIETNQTIWKQTLDCDLNRFGQSYLSRRSDFPIIVDLDADGSDEWIAPLHVPGFIWREPMTPPYGMVMAHRGRDGQALWPEPFRLPNMDGMIERGLVIADQDGDGWKELLLGSRFQGVGLGSHVGCFVDVISGQSGQRIWQRQVQTESTKPNAGRTELVDLAIIEDQRLIAVVTHSGVNPYNFESARPYSTNFLSIEDGQQAAFGLGIWASHFHRDMWLEQRLAPREPIGRITRLPSQLVGWTYPPSQEDSSENRTLWSTEEYSASEVVDLNRDGYPEVVGSRSEVGFREYTLLDGVTGKKGWRREMPGNDTTFWFSLKRDADNDAIDDLVVLIYDNNDQRQYARVEMISGSTGKTIWKHADDDPGSARALGSFDRSGHLALFVYQNEQTNSVTCLDLDARKVAWSSNSFLGTLEPQAFESWKCDGKIVWFSTSQTEQGGQANFVNAETGESLLQFAIGQKLGAPWTNWIRWDGRELLPIQTTTMLEPGDGQLATECRTDLWLVDRSLKVGSWSETTDAASSKVVSSWLEMSNYDMSFPAIVKTSDGRELLGITTCFDRSIGVRLLGWDGSETKNVVTERSIALPIDPSSTSAYVEILDCNGDGVSDFVSMSDDGIDCLSGTGDLLWHQSPIPTAGNLGSFERHGRSYLSLQTQPYDHNSMHFLDARTGQTAGGIQNEPEYSALNSDNPDHCSLITCDYTARSSILTAIRKPGARVPRIVQTQNDPRYVRMLPWVISAKSLLAQNPVTMQRLSWPRILKLIICVFCLPAVVAWSCLRKRFSLRHVLLIATTVAVALSVSIADKVAHPMAASPDGYITALSSAFQVFQGMFLLVLPIIELTRTRWRRRLSIGLYVAMLFIVPTLMLVTMPAGGVRTTYVPDDFWHLLWLALVPTGMLLFLVHGLRLFGIGTMQLVKAVRRIIKPRQASNASAPPDAVLPETGGPNG